jgi:hypothetical protein
MVVVFITICAITINALSSIPVNDKAYSIQHYVIQFANSLLQASGFRRAPLFRSPIKLDATIELKYYLK